MTEAPASLAANAAERPAPPEPIIKTSTMKNSVFQMMSDE
jgi:hypothetical protein